jgi:alkylated DNA repair dioxygenase AlkB
MNEYVFPSPAVNENLDLFSSPAVLETISLPDAELAFARCFYTAEQAACQLQDLLAGIAWRQEHIQLWGKQHLHPRLTAWHGDAGSHYSYSGLALTPQAWTPSLAAIKRDIEAASGHSYNSVLLNLYRNENDRVGWHSDNETELGREPAIASLSLGATRTFEMRHKRRKDLPVFSLELPSGSLLLMSGTTQACWQHAVEKEKEATGPRINLTFRQILG